MKDLTKGSITKLIFWFALPVFIGSLLQMTYNLVYRVCIRRKFTGGCRFY